MILESEVCLLSGLAKQSKLKDIRHVLEEALETINGESFVTTVVEDIEDAIEEVDHLIQNETFAKNKIL